MTYDDGWPYDVEPARYPRPWRGAIDTDKSRSLHHVFNGRVWCLGQYCSPADPCGWCRDKRGDKRVWLPAADTDEYALLVRRLADALNAARASISDDWCLVCSNGEIGLVYHDGLCPVHGDVRAMLAALREAT